LPSLAPAQVVVIAPPQYASPYHGYYGYASPYYGAYPYYGYYDYAPGYYHYGQASAFTGKDMGNWPAGLPVLWQQRSPTTRRLSGRVADGEALLALFDRSRWREAALRYVSRHSISRRLRSL